MTNEEKEQSGQIPPKIKLKKANESPESGGKTPPKARPISAPKSDTSRVDVPDDKLAENEELPRSNETMRVVLPKANDTETGTFRKKGLDKPKKTIKIKRPGTVAASTEPGKTESEEPKTVVQARPASRPKHDTSRIDISKAKSPPSSEQVESSKEDTMRVILEEMSEKGDTGKVDQGDKPPRTVKIKRSAMDAGGGETVVDSSEQKSSTAKLNLPESESEEPSSGRKTIRIKRSGADTAGQGKTLKISRPEAVKSAPLPTVAEEARASIESRGTFEGPHIIFTIAALFTVVISGVLIYLMCTQMPFGDSLPWPNKIITEWQGSTEMIFVGRDRSRT